MTVLELFQAEWCPASHRVRQRLTELGLDYVIRQVPVELDERAALRAATGAETIPVLRLENGSAVAGERHILAYLSEQLPDSPEAEAHRRKAETIRLRLLDEACECREALVAQ